MKTLFMQITFLLVCLSLHAQGPKTKWGKISEKEKLLEYCAFDSTAEAVVLYHSGNIDLNYQNILFSNHKRIKILSENAENQADVIIPFYHKDGIENIKNVKAHTIIFKDGKMEKIPVDKKDIYKVKVDEFWSEIRFSFASFQKGAILEYKYQTVSESYTNLESWSFQSDIPTLYSEISATIAASLDYKIFFQGQRLIDRYVGKVGNSWSLDNLPAIKEEPFCPNPMDYTEKVFFQLVGYSSGMDYTSILNTWEKLAVEVLNHSDFRKITSKNQMAKELVESIISPEDDPPTRLSKIYDHLVENYTWNDIYGFIPDQSLKSIIEQKSASGAGLNLMLVFLLQKAELDANPVLISTKRHGVVSKNYPLVSQFNHLIAQVNVNGKDILMDARHPVRPYDLLDSRDLNGEGFLLHKKSPRWIPLTPNKKTSTIQLVKMDISDPAQTKYKIEIVSKGYDAVNMRSKIKSAENTKAYLIEEYLKENASLTIDSFQVKDFMSREKPFSLVANITDQSVCTVHDDFVYINPFVDQSIVKNPFEVKPRYLPVDFYHPYSEKYILNIEIPEDYEILEIPANSAVKLPEGRVYLKTGSVQSGNHLQILLDLSIKDPLIPARDYLKLVEIFDLYLSKREEQIVLKKKT